jgi:uncharacterized protein (DUF1684 family)
MDEQEHLREVERWRARRIAGLTGPNGWLSVVGLAWLHEGPNSLGGDPANDVVLPGDGVPARIGLLDVRDGRAVANLLPGSRVTGPNGAGVERLVLEDDSEEAPTILRVGTVSVHIIQREQRLAVRMRDSASEARRTFQGIEHYPVDIRWRFEARFEPYEPGRFAAVPTVLGQDETYRVPGALAFEHGGALHRLDAFLEHDDDDLFVVFGDRTNRTETYQGGRFVYAPKADEHGIVALDFNRAYNPPCVFTPYATCPLPLARNRLPLPVEAGEKRYPWTDLSPG